MQREKSGWPRCEAGWSERLRSWDGRWLGKKEVGLRECFSESSLEPLKAFFEVDKFIVFTFNMDIDLFGTRFIILQKKLISCH